MFAVRVGLGSLKGGLRNGGRKIDRGQEKEREGWERGGQTRSLQSYVVYLQVYIFYYIAAPQE